jgi:protein-tyrosine phosphatase
LDLAIWGYQKWQSGSKLLVRCAAGENRSGLITLLILQKHGIQTDEAVDLIRAERKKGSPLHNPHFIEFARKEFGNY